jgi:hypothetical protein
MAAKRRGQRKLNKAKLLRRIRVEAETAYHLRKAGMIPNALFHESKVDQAINEARAQGYAQEAEDAESVGQERARKRK